jgi:hypothetical protein
MRHARQVLRLCPIAQKCASVLVCVLLTVGCGDNGTTPPGTLRFGQLGQIRVHLDVPLQLRAGKLEQTLTWGSSGAWTFQESIWYRGLVGDEAFMRNPGDPSIYASDYASLITQVNEVTGLELWIEELPRDLDPDCGLTQTRVTFTVFDEVRNEERELIRCANGSMSNLSTVDAGPDPAASRVALAAQLARNRTLGEDFISAYAGSVPFGTLDRGDDTPTRLGAPVAFLDQSSWTSFWRTHAGTGATPPTVDFAEEMVIAGAVGPRGEAGDSVEVRRILQVADGTLTEVFERVPGDFCSPASRSHVPYHIVVAPRTPTPIRFSEVRVERVPCGG